MRSRASERVRTRRPILGACVVRPRAAEARRATLRFAKQTKGDEHRIENAGYANGAA